ncbi:MAG TPA: heme biosynthesis HemY N-terminal domain-containing protein [Xanthobacteraceae bacterium]
MTRIVVFLLVVALIGFGAAWIADRPGEVAITWQGWRMETSLAVAAVVLSALIAFAILFWSFVRFILRSPDLITFFLRERRRARGWRAISNGLIAIGTGNLALASRSAADAKKFAGDEPLTLLLAAQAAQLEGAGERAEAEFKAMLGRPETRLLGLRGLYVEARRRNDPGTARAVAEEAERDNPALSWTSEAQIEFQCLAGNWAGALETVERAGRAGAIDRATLKRRRAVLLTTLAQANEEKDIGKARADAVEAVKLAPDLVPAAALAGRLLGAEGKLRRAAWALEAAWKASPHPDLAEVYMDLRPGDSARDRLKRAKKLAKKSPGHIEGALAVARAALDATEFDQARMALAPFLEDPTQRVCLLMAEIEASERGDHGKAREWSARAMRARRDAAWVADGYVSERWLPASPVTGRLDAFVWVAPSPDKAPVLEQATTARSKPLVKVASAPLVPAPGAAEEAAARRIAPPRTPVEREAAEPIVAEPPLPDDPGPEPAADAPPRRFRLFDWLARPSA